MNASNKCSVIRSRFSVERAFYAQKILSQRVVMHDDFARIKIVTGADLSYIKTIDGQEYGIAVLAFFTYPSLRFVECRYAVTEICVPYIPGLLAFREMPPLALALARSKHLRPDLLVVDGHGYAHPRRFGIASHVGVVTDIPSIGVAKKRLIGREEGDILYHEGEVIAKILERGRSRIYVSIGHKVSLDTAVRLVKSMWKRGRLPEPTRVADSISKKLKGTLSARLLGKKDVLVGTCSYEKTYINN